MHKSSVFLYMENRQTKDNILSEYQKYSLKKYKVLCKKSVPLSSILNENILSSQVNTTYKPFNSNPCISALSG